MSEPVLSMTKVPGPVDEAIGRRLVLTKQVFYNAVSLSRDVTDISRILAILQLDFSVETLLK
ncbi:MAG TPA: hypothetical protein VGS11_11820 [Candidatus Bathyarchaeia archaeon]|nr:hypothetical protein [Candidatus Bathyarchaeia archaeon]